MTMPADARQPGQHLFQRLGAAGGGADGDDAFGGLRHGARPAGRQHGIGVSLGRRAAPAARARAGGRQAPHIGPGGGAHGASSSSADSAGTA
jgi:hypothetical protein